MNRTLLAGAFLTATATAALTLSVPAGAAVPPQGKIGPNQVFAGSVNGQTGFATPVVVRMACFGPIRPGQTGHPLAGQTLEVFRPEVIAARTGFTGPNGTSISVFFNAPPPSPVTVLPPLYWPLRGRQLSADARIGPEAARGRARFEH